MLNETVSQESGNPGQPSPKQLRAKMKEILDAETTFGSARAARFELLETVADIIQEYLNHGSPIVYVHAKLKEAGYAGSRKELSEWLFAKGLREKREMANKEVKQAEIFENAISEPEHPQKAASVDDRPQERQPLKPKLEQNDVVGSSVKSGTASADPSELDPPSSVERKVFTSSNAVQTGSVQAPVNGKLSGNETSSSTKISFPQKHSSASAVYGEKGKN